MTTRQLRQFGLVMAMSICLGWSVAAFGQGDSLLRQRRVESQAVEDYLRSLQLDGLVIEHLEFETSRELNREARRKMAARLINEYAERMMSGRNLLGIDWKSKAELLLQTYPGLSTPAIRIAILQAKYRIGEDAFVKWWDAGRDKNQRNELASNWFELKTELELLNLQLNAAYEDQVALLQANADNSDSQSRQLTRLDGLMLHTDYLIGWSSYFLGILTTGDRKTLMSTADSHFRTFLQIEPKKTLTDVPPEWIDFSSDWNARALVGLAMCQRGLDHPLQSEHCFNLIENHASNQQTREQRFVWDLNSRVYLDEVSAALEIVDSMGEARHLSESGRTAFWQATLNASRAIGDRAPVISKRLLRSGLTGLARQFDASRIETFLNENRFQIDGDDFLSLWIAGYLDFHNAETSQDSIKYEKAKTKLTAALAIVDEETNPFDIARCRFLLARIQFQDREYDAASNAFLECSKSLEVIAPELSAESMWLAVRALSEQRRTSSRTLIQANRAIDQLMRRFPGSTYAKRAAFERLRLNVSDLDPESAINRLARIGPTDSNYPLAANEIVKIRYKSWSVAHQAKSESESQKFEALLMAGADFERLETASENSKLKAQLLVVDAMLKTKSIGIESIRQRMEQMKRRAETPGIDSPILQEYRYYRFRLAIRSKNEPQAMTEAQWLFENAKGTPFEKSAMIQFAQLADQRFASQVNPTRDEVAEVTTIFTKLVGLLGSSETELKQSPNARVAYARLAALKLANGSTDEAIEMLVLLNAIFPNHKSYLRQLASTYTQSQQYAEAIPVWQKLVRGVNPGSDLWLESKYNLAFCLYHLGKLADARTLHEQTCRLSPTLPQRWVKRFDELSALLAAD